MVECKSQPEVVSPVAYEWLFEERLPFGLANEEARVRISVDAVRGIGPLRMIRREVNRPAVTAGLCANVRSHKQQRLKVILSLQPHFCCLLILVPGHRENLMPPHLLSLAVNNDSQLVVTPCASHPPCHKPALRAHLSRVCTCPRALQEYMEDTPGYVNMALPPLGQCHQPRPPVG